MPIQRQTAQMARLAPGFLLTAVVAAIATLVNNRVPLLSAMLVAILVGLVARNMGLVPAAADPGLKVVGRTVLRAGVVLLGLRLSIPAVMALGWGAIAVIAATVTCVYLATLALGRALRVPHATVVLTATGTAICGAAAVAGMSAVVRSDGEDDDVEDAAATAIASVTLFGTLMIVALPLLVEALGLAERGAGVWVGASVHEVGQVVAAGGLISAGVLDAAVLAKLGRVVLLAPLVAIVGVVEARRAERRARLAAERSEVGDVLAGAPVEHSVADGPGGPAREGAGARAGSAGNAGSAPIVPLFVIGFLLAVLLRSFLDGVLPASVFSWGTQVAGFLLTMAMCAMGAGVNLRRLAATGLRSLALGAGAGVVSAAVSLLGVLALVG